MLTIEINFADAKFVVLRCDYKHDSPISTDKLKRITILKTIAKTRKWLTETDNRKQKTN